MLGHQRRWPMLWKTHIAHTLSSNDEFTHNSHSYRLYICIFYDELNDLSWHKLCQRSCFQKGAFAVSELHSAGRGRLQWVWWQATKVIFWFRARAQPSAVFSLRLNIILEFVRVQCGIKSLSSSRTSLEQASKWPLGVIHMVHCVRQSLLYKIILWARE